MSGTGQSGSSAPVQLTPMSMDQPIGQTVDGKPVIATFYFGQVITRILAYLGQPVPGSNSGGGSNLTIGEQILALQTSISVLEATANASGSGLSSRIAEIESILRRPGVLARDHSSDDVAVNIAKTIAVWGM